MNARVRSGQAGALTPALDPQGSHPALKGEVSLCSMNRGQNGVLLLIAAQMIYSTAGAATRMYRPELGATPGIRFSLPYTLGTHDGTAKMVKGSLRIDPDNLTTVSGTLEVPIDSLDTDHAERDCHMCEALGLNYAQSNYPEEHVCDENNRLPKSGDNAVVFPTLQFQVDKVRSLEEGGRILPQGVSRIEVDGKWTIHGVTRVGRLPLEVTRERDGFRLKGQIPFSLQDHGIEVKSAKILFLTIRVDDQATVQLDLLLKESKS